MTEKITKDLTVQKIRLLVGREKEVDKVVLETVEVPRITWKPRKNYTHCEDNDGFVTEMRGQRALTIDKLPQELKDLNAMVKIRPVGVRLSYQKWDRKDDESGEVRTYYFLKGKNPFEGINIPEKKEDKVVEEVVGKPANPGFGGA